MDRLLNLQTALSLGYVGLMAGTAYLSSRLFLDPASTSSKVRAIFLWLAFDSICHLTLEGSFLYLSLQGRTVNTSNSFFGYLWQEYSQADKRWGVSDPTVVSLEYLTVLAAGPLAAYCCLLLAKRDPVYHYWAVVLSTAELYGGFMTFAPEWLTGSPNLDASNWLFLWVYLAFMNLLWVAVPLYLMFDSFGYIATALRSHYSNQTHANPTLNKSSSKATRASSPQTKASLLSTHGISGTAYTLFLCLLFFYLMPTASASASSSFVDVKQDEEPRTTIFPHPSNGETPWQSLKVVLLPIVVTGGLVSLSLFFGAIQVAEKAIRNVKRTNRSRRKNLLAQLDIMEKPADGQPKRTILGIFHPYCNAGGGGERVLYEAISYHQQSDPEMIVAIYTGDFPTSTKQEILDKASSRFGISLDSSKIVLIPLRRRWMVEATQYPHFTLLGQMYGSIWLGFEGFSQLIPDLFIDTMGYSFVYPISKLFNKNLPVGAYIHYPIISTDMLKRVQHRESGHTNPSSTANSFLRTWVKLQYYRLFMTLYRWSLRKADAIVVNGSWTRNHIDQIVNGDATKTKQNAKRARNKTRDIQIVYPPCDTQVMVGFPLENRRPWIVSLAQFRPEKEHITQLYILKRLSELRPDLFSPPPTTSSDSSSSASSSSREAVKLIMMGSSRHESDELRIKMLASLISQLGLSSHVEILVNKPFNEILQILRQASVGLSTMKDEHFGINVVEFMASGLITLSHKSAGPWLDIATPMPVGSNNDADENEDQDEDDGFQRVEKAQDGPSSASSSSSPSFSKDPQMQITGYHALEVEEFAQRLAEIIDMDSQEQLKIRKAARQRAVQVFGRDGFKSSWQQWLWEPLSQKHLNSETKPKSQ